MKRSKSTGRSDGKRRSTGRSSGPKKSFSGPKRGAAGKAGSRPFRKSEGEGGERKYSDRPERSSSSERSGAKRSFSSDRAPSRDRNEGDSGERKKFSDRSTSRSPFKREGKSVDKPFRKRSDDDSENKKFTRGSDRKPFRRDDSEKPSRSYGSDRERNANEESSSPERKPFRERSAGGDNSKRRRVGEDSGEKRSTGYRGKSDERRATGTGERRSPARGRDDSGKREFSPRTSGERTSRPSRDGDRNSDSRESRPFNRDSGKSSGDGKPWNRKEKHEFYGDRKKKTSFSKQGPDDGSTRLNKFIANAGICSRREADDLIAAGVVSVNGKVVTEMGYKVMPDDQVKYNNELLRSENMVYILLNKPKDFITTTDDPEDRKTVMNLIAKACKERVYPVGRLDRNTTGVLLFTNDGDLAKKLTHPSFQVHKVYQAELDRNLKGTDMDLLSAGVELEDGFVKPDDVVYVGTDKNLIGMELHSGKNRIVRRMFEHLGYEVKKLDRVVFAGLTKKDLPRGRWRFLTDMEVANLKMITGKATKAKQKV